MFIMIDGIDGGGKSTIIDAWKEYLSNQGNAIFDLKKYFLENNRYPEISEMGHYDFIFSAEPTHTGVGKILRDELASTKNNYPPEIIAEAHSVDRMILYTKAIIPALKNDRIVIQDRGISTSLAYQPCQDPALTVQKVSQYAGNRLATEYRPDHLVIVDIDPQVAYDRLTSRHDKQDNAVFEKLDFMKKSVEKFKDNEFKNFFLGLGTQLHYLSGEEKIDIMRGQAIDLLKTILK